MACPTSVAEIFLFIFFARCDAYQQSEQQFKMFKYFFLFLGYPLCLYFDIFKDFYHLTLILLTWKIR